MAEDQLWYNELNSNNDITVHTVCVAYAAVVD